LECENSKSCKKCVDARYPLDSDGDGAFDICDPCSKYKNSTIYKGILLFNQVLFLFLYLGKCQLCRSVFGASCLECDENEGCKLCADGLTLFDANLDGTLEQCIDCKTMKNSTVKDGFFFK
jgi:hypothetical protein